MHRTSEITFLINGESYRLVTSECDLDPASFLEAPPLMGGAIRFLTCDQIFSVDAVCAAAMLYAKRTHVQENTVVFVECSGIDELVPAVVDPDSGHVSVVLPTPEASASGDTGFMISFPGVARILCRSDQLSNPDPVDAYDFAVECDPDDGSIQVFSPLLTGRRDPVRDHGLAAAAAGVYFARTIQDGVTEHDVCMQNAVAEVGVSMRAGQLAGLSIQCGVRLVGDVRSSTDFDG